MNNHNGENNRPVPLNVPPEHLPSKAIVPVQLPGMDNNLLLPTGAELLCCRTYRGAPTLFFLCATPAPAANTVRRFIVVPAQVEGLRGDLTAASYVATLQTQSDCLHVLEVPVRGLPILPS